MVHSTQTTVLDARGHTAAVQQYTTPPTVTGSVVSGGAHQDTAYGYDPLGRLVAMTDPGGAHWTTTFDGVLYEMTIISLGHEDGVVLELAELSAGGAVIGEVRVAGGLVTRMQEEPMPAAV